MTKRNAIKDFLSLHFPFNDYWCMQYAWNCFIDGLCKDKVITQKQFQNWGNPCTPETFKKFNKKFKG